MIKCLFTTLVPWTLFPKGNFSLIFPEISSDCVTVWICLYILKYLDDFLNPCKVKLHLYCVFSSCLEGAVWQVLCMLRWAPEWSLLFWQYLDYFWGASWIFPLLDVLCYQFSASILGQSSWMVVKDDSVSWNRNPSATFPHLIRQSRVGLLLSHAKRKELLQREILLSTIVKECWIWCRVTW